MITSIDIKVKLIVKVMNFDLLYISLSKTSLILWRDVMIKGLLVCLLLLVLGLFPWLFGLFNTKSVDWTRSQYEVYTGAFTFQGKEYISIGIDTMFGKY